MTSKHFSIHFISLNFFFFFFNDTATTEIYTLSLHDALPISRDGDGGIVPAASQGDLARDRRGGSHLLGDDQRLHQHRRRPRHGGARRTAPRGHGVLAVPPDRGRGRRRSHHRGRARRGRLPPQQERRALHGALRAQQQGPREPRRRVASDDHRDQGRARLRAARRLPRAQAFSLEAGGHHQAPPRNP